MTLLNDILNDIVGQGGLLLLTVIAPLIIILCKDIFELIEEKDPVLGVKTKRFRYGGKLAKLVEHLIFATALWMLVFLVCVLAVAAFVAAFRWLTEKDVMWLTMDGVRLFYNLGRVVTVFLVILLVFLMIVIRHREGGLLRRWEN